MNIEADAYSDTKSVYNSKAVASWNAGNVTKTANMPGSTGGYGMFIEVFYLEDPNNGWGSVYKRRG